MSARGFPVWSQAKGGDVWLQRSPGAALGGLQLPLSESKGLSAQPLHLRLLAVKRVKPSLLLPHSGDNLTLVSVIQSPCLEEGREFLWISDAGAWWQQRSQSRSRGSAELGRAVTPQGTFSWEQNASLG